jgi:3-oxoadipate enol-lactonase
MTKREHINGVDVAFTDQGEGPTVVLLHPFPFNHRFWTGNVPSLVHSGHRVIAVDAPGFGDSAPTPEPLSISAIADLVAGLLDQLKMDRATVLGLSMGGYVALAFAAKFADRLTALVLADSRAAADGPTAREGREEALRTIRERGVKAYLDQSLPHLLAPQAALDLAAHVRLLAETRSETLMAGILAMRDRADRSTDLGRIACPTLVVVGEFDQISPSIEMRGISVAIPNARFVELPGAGHLSSIEAPAAFNRAIGDFLCELRSLPTRPGAS